MTVSANAGAGRAQAPCPPRSLPTTDGVVHNASVSTPSQRLWARRAEWDDGGLSGPPRSGPAVAPATLVEAAERVRIGSTSLRGAVADVLDDLRLAVDGADVERRIVDEPGPAGPRTDAYLGALAEHVAGVHGLVVPEWALAPGRFLDHFWWPSRTVGLHARALVESPAAFRRRGIFIGRSTLRRV